MSAKRTYLDYNATAPLHPEVRERMQEAAEFPLNPSSVHAYGRQARKILEDSRKTLADIISVWPREIIFTASGTEANNLALKGVPGREIFVSAIEHSSVLGRGITLPVDASGLLDLVALEKALQSATAPILVSVMLANNETGVIQPIGEIANIVHRHGGIFHTDAVQALGKIPLDAGLLKADMITLSAHKCGGPVGAAALVVRGEIPLTPLLTGGGQELGRRAGTENVPAVAGFAKAAELAQDFAHMQGLRGWLDDMERALDTATVFSKDAPRLPNTSCIAMPGVSNEVQLMHFDLQGFMVSAGSACSSGRIAPSHVLSAMGVEEKAASSAIRISAGWNTKKEEIEAFSEEWKQLHARLSDS